VIEGSQNQILLFFSKSMKNKPLKEKITVTKYTKKPTSKPKWEQNTKFSKRTAGQSSTAHRKSRKSMKR